MSAEKAFERFHNLPEEIRAYSQWVVWRYVIRDGQKPTKVPRDPKTGGPASVSDTRTWGTFDQACNAVHNYDGIGFVFTEQDPFSGIDLDDTEGDEAALRVQQKIFEEMGSYAERSPSGKGLHIIVRGQIPNGRRRGKIELYSSGRFFTMTGDVYNNAPIAERQVHVSALWHELGGIDESQHVQGEPVERLSDQEVIEKAFGAANREKFLKLHRGEWDSDYPSQSEADQAYMNLLAFNTKHRAQLARLFRASPLGQRKKAEREDYVGRMISNSLDGKLPWHCSAEAIAWGREIAERMTIHGESLMAGLRSMVVPTSVGWFKASSLAGKPVKPRRWHVKGLIPSEQVTMLSGDGGTGKSLIALQLAVSTATGVQWLGNDVRAGPAMFVSAEDSRDELHRRLSAIGDLRDMDRLLLCSLAGEDALLAVPRDRSNVLTRTPVFDDLDARISVERPALVVLDTLADFFGGNENDRAQARQFIGMLRGLAIRHKCAVLLLSHPSVAGMASGVGTSGSTGWNNSVRSRLYLSRVIGDNGYEPNPDARLLTTKKSNYGRAGGEIHIHWHDGRFVACNLPTGEERNAKAESVFLKLLEEVCAQGRRVNSSGGQTYAPKVFADHPQSEGITKRGFKSAMEKLFATGKIRSVETGPPSKRRSHILPENALPNLFQSENQPFQTPTGPPPDARTNPRPNGGVPPP
jgi:RecA-family ATPase